MEEIDRYGEGKYKEDRQTDGQREKDRLVL